MVERWLSLIFPSVDNASEYVSARVLVSMIRRTLLRQCAHSARRIRTLEKIPASAKRAEKDWKDTGTSVGCAKQERIIEQMKCTECGLRRTNNRMEFDFIASKFTGRCLTCARVIANDQQKPATAVEFRRDSVKAYLDQQIKACEMKEQARKRERVIAKLNYPD